ncbi:MAG: hypothetical protein EOP11_08045 [Proteobacteria bacterium]|nr:MAG: hypothetical protein EOP11_08045 [Pseudomonadota bacterium]
MFQVLALLFSFSPALAADLPHLDKDFTCLDAKQAARYVDDFSIDVGSFGGLDLCDNARDTKKLLNDIYLIDKTEFGAEVNHPFVRGMVDRDQYYSWMKSQTRGVNRGHDIPFATAYNSWGYFTMQDGWAALSTLGRVGTIIHEARHTAGYRHYACDHGPYAASRVAGCDTSYEQGGSHAVEMEYYTRVILEAKNLNPVYKSMARLMALGRSNFVFNKTPMKTREGLLARDGAKLTLIDGEKVVDRTGPAVAPDFRLRRTSFGASLVSGTKARALDLYDAETSAVEKSDDYSYYKQFQIARPTGPGSFKAIEEYDVGNLRFLVVLDNENRVHSYDFPNGVWHDPVTAPRGTTGFVTTAPGGQRGLFAKINDASLVPFDASRLSFAAPLAERFPEDALSYAYLGKTLVRLSSDGRATEAASGAPLAKLGQTYTDLINVPLYDAYEVAP